MWGWGLVVEFFYIGALRFVSCQELGDSSGRKKTCIEIGDFLVLKYVLRQSSDLGNFTGT